MIDSEVYDDLLGSFYKLKSAFCGLFVAWLVTMVCALYLLMKGAC